MAERLVAADASPLIGLAAAGAFDLLRRLFGEVTVTNAVRDEVLAGRELPGAKELANGINDGWIKVVRNCPDVATFPDLDVGEASVLTLALEYAGPCLVLMDEPFGRSHAREHELIVTGLAGVLLAAKESRLVCSVRPYFERLARSDFRLSKEIVRAILEQAGEAQLDKPPTPP